MSYNNPYDPGLTTFNIGQNAQARAKQRKGDTKDTRGTGLTQSPTQPLAPHAPTAPSTGVTPLGNDKGPMKQMHDNVMNYHKREAQKMFNTGPNKGAAEKNAAMGIDSFGRGPVGNMASRIKGLFGFQDDALAIGRSIETASMFEKSPPVQVAQKKQKFTGADDTGTTVEQADDKKWIQKAVPESHKGKFTAYCKQNGFGGVNDECIAHAMKEGGHAAKMAQFAKSMRHLHPKK